MYVIFADSSAFELISAKGKNEIVESAEDMITAADRLTLELRFDSTVVDMERLKPYFLNPNEKTSVIMIQDDNGEVFTHTDYVIRLKFSLEYVDGNSNPYIIMKFAQLNETDKALREVAGKVKTYVGTELQVTIAKKVDEVSKACNIAIESGVDYNDEHYSLTSQDQTNILAWGNRASNGMYVPYHADGQHCRPYAPEEFSGLVEAAIGHIAHHTTYCNLLMRWVETLDDISVINEVKYGITELTGTYLEEYNANMALLISGVVSE